MPNVASRKQNFLYVKISVQCLTHKDSHFIGNKIAHTKSGKFQKLYFTFTLPPDSAK